MEEEFQDRNGWSVEQVKLIGKKFFLIAFAKAIDRDVALEAAPWFMFKSFVFMAAWNPNFNVHKDFRTKIPTWIELPYRSLILETSRKKLALALDPILHFIQGEECSSYPHDHTCILWDVTQKTLRWLKI